MGVFKDQPRRINAFSFQNQTMAVTWTILPNKALSLSLSLSLTGSLLLLNAAALNHVHRAAHAPHASQLPRPSIKGLSSLLIQITGDPGRESSLREIEGEGEGEGEGEPGPEGERDRGRDRGKGPQPRSKIFMYTWQYAIETKLAGSEQKIASSVPLAVSCTARHSHVSLCCGCGFVCVCVCVCVRALSCGRFFAIGK
jgi:hypothetical protein